MIWLHLPVPGPVLGMVMLFITLVLRGRTSPALSDTANDLLNHLSLLFVPAGVGLMVHFDLIMREWLPISITLVVSTVITMVSTAGIMLGMNWLMARRKHHG